MMKHTTLYLYVNDCLYWNDLDFGLRAAMAALDFSVDQAIIMILSRLLWLGHYGLAFTRYYYIIGLHDHRRAITTTAN